MKVKKINPKELRSMGSFIKKLAKRIEKKPVKFRMGTAMFTCLELIT